MHSSKISSGFKTRSGISLEGHRGSAPPGATHQDKANTIRFVSRPLSMDLSPEVAFNDVKVVMEFVISADAPLATAVGVDLALGEEPIA